MSISKDARIGANVTIGEYCVIEPGVTIGDNTVIGHHVVIRSASQIGANVRIDDHSVIGKNPMRSARSALRESKDLAPAIVGDDCIIGTSAIIYTGCEIGAKVLVADLATVREKVYIGRETIVGRGVAIENDCRIGMKCKLETNAYITAYSVLEDYVFVAPGVVTSNDNFVGRSKERYAHFKGVTVERGGRIGAQATILPGKRIGEDALVAAGSLVTHDVPAKMLVMGAPAREKKAVPEEQLLDHQDL